MLKIFFSYKSSVILVILISGPFLESVSRTGDMFYLTDGIHKFGVNPETFSLTYVSPQGKEYLLSGSSGKEVFSGLQRNPADISWEYPGKGIRASLTLGTGYLDVSLQGYPPSVYRWPEVGKGVDAYTIPLHQGKFIPAGDSAWAAYLQGQGPMNALEALSMQFFALNIDESAFVFVIKNMFNNKLEFYDDEGTIALNFIHEFTVTAAENRYGFRIYPVKNDINEIAKTYKEYVSEKKGIVTLEEKAAKNPDIRKLYGAPHIYIWNNEFIVEENIKNRAAFGNYFMTELLSAEINPARHLLNLFDESQPGRSFKDAMQESEHNLLNSAYGIRLFISAVNETLGRKDFSDDVAFRDILYNPDIREILENKEALGTNRGIYKFNKLLFYHSFSSYLEPVSEWGGAPLSLLEEMRSAEIKNAWLGFSSWVAGEIHPAFVSEAKRNGYLTGPYDSYHSIHPPGEERWLTATFEDTTLYHSAYIMNKRGDPEGGFLGVGRKLNPVLSLRSVMSRTQNVLRQGIGFNSWFIDCDAAGECYDDYTPSRMTGQKEDSEARLERMSWIRDTHKLVIGSEVGNDFAANTIAYAHGMTTPVIAWGDPDMRSNRDSEYFAGAYYSVWGGIPGRYVKQVPVKEKYRYIYFDNRFNIPLFQLVYNNAVITSHHWEWGSLKVPAEITHTRLKEILYNVPPLYHLDRNHWRQFKDIISSHTKVFAKTHSMAVVEEMSSFEWLRGDRLVQKTRFGESLEIIANFGSHSFDYDGIIIPGKGLVIIDTESEDFYLYQP